MATYFSQRIVTNQYQRTNSSPTAQELRGWPAFLLPLISIHFEKHIFDVDDCIKSFQREIKLKYPDYKDYRVPIRTALVFLCDKGFLVVRDTDALRYYKRIGSKRPIVQEVNWNEFVEQKIGIKQNDAPLPNNAILKMKATKPPPDFSKKRKIC